MRKRADCVSVQLVLSPCVVLCYVQATEGEEEWSADLAGIWESRPGPDRRGMCGSEPASFSVRVRALFLHLSPLSLHCPHTYILLSGYIAVDKVVPVLCCTLFLLFSLCVVAS